MCAQGTRDFTSVADLEKEQRKKANGILVAQAHPLGEGRCDDAGQLVFACRSEGAAASQEEFDSFEFVVGEGRAGWKAIQLLLGRRREDLERAAEVRALLGDHDRARDQVSEPTKLGVTTHDGQAERVPHWEEIGGAE